MEKLGPMSDEKLVHQEVELERKLLDLSFRLRTGQLDDTSKLGRLRRDIARLRTAERQRELAADLPKDALRNRYRSTWKYSAPEAEDAAPQQQASRGFLKGIVDKIKGSE